MENPRADKVALVDEVRAKLTAADAALLTEYRGLKVAELASLRQALGGVGGEYKIYKNTLVRFAANDLGLGDLVGLLQGPTAIAFVNGDAAEVAKVLREFAKTSPALVVKGGVLGTSVLSASQAGDLADLPSRDVLLARVAGTLAAPMRQMAGLLQALPRSFAYGLKALLDQRGGAPDPESTGTRRDEVVPDALITPSSDEQPPPAAAEPPASEPGEPVTTPQASADDRDGANGP
ncbi:MAG: 50S ribosomal protein L10 [Acidimicrobiales bacterium]